MKNWGGSDGGPLVDGTIVPNGKLLVLVIHTISDVLFPAPFHTTNVTL